MGRPNKHPQITARTLVLVETFMETQGLDYARAVRAAGIDPAVIGDPDADVPLTSFMALLEDAAQAWGNDAFGVLLGESYPFGKIGVFDYALANAPTLEVVLQNYVRFLNLVVGGFDTRFERGPHQSHLTMSLPPILGPHVQAMDAAVTAQVVRIRHIMGDPTFAMTVELKRRRPQMVAEFERVLGPGLRFNRPQNRIGIATADLHKPVPAADSVLYDVIEATAEKALHARRTQTDPISRLALFLGKELTHGEIKLDSAAAALGLPVGQLTRELRNAGTTYQQFVRTTRKSMAAHYIKNSDMPLTEVAFLLGFSELSAFSRAAKGWFGETAREIRKQGRSEPSD